MLIQGNYYKKDIEVMEWLKETYQNYNIANKVTYILTEFLRSISFDNDTDKDKMENLGKAIRQDLKKMLLAAKKIYEYSQVDRSKDSLFVLDEADNPILNYNEDKDCIQIQMEYFVTKYRVIIEYTTNIILKVVMFDKNAYKKMYPNNVDQNGKLLIRDFEINNIKLKYFNNFAFGVGDIIKDKFDPIRRIRNDVIHNGASCVIFDGEELLFQIYNLNVDEITCTGDYLSNGSAISCKYFITVNIAYLVYYLDSVFSVLLNDELKEDSIMPYCQKNYIFDKKQESDKVTVFLQHFFGETFDNISDSQECIMEIIEGYCKTN